jgi:hypothetical protein
MGMVGMLLVMVMVGMLCVGWVCSGWGGLCYGCTGYVMGMAGIL